MNDLFLRSCRRQPVERTPVWFMRQAGRSLPEYRAVREEVDFVTLCRTPELAAKVTLQPIDRLGVDAAILFSDILVPAECLGIEVDFAPGPVLESPIRSAAQISRLDRRAPQESVPFVFETLRILRRELEGRVPLIGFAGAPLTLAAYLVEGRGSKNFSWFKRLLFADAAAAHALLERITEVTVAYLEAQVEAGAQAIQLFDTWAGLLGVEQYREFGLRYVRRIMDGLAGCGVPRIYFAMDAHPLADEVRQCGADVLGVDWRIRLEHAAAALGTGFAYQGNLDPTLLFAEDAIIERHAREVIDAGRDLPGHIFNLGHGVLPDTPVEKLERLVRFVQRESLR